MTHAGSNGGIPAVTCIAKRHCTLSKRPTAAASQVRVCNGGSNLSGGLQGGGLTHAIDPVGEWFQDSLVLVGLESFNHHLQTLPAGSKPSGAACAAINTLCIACLLDKHRARAALGCRSVQARPAAGKTALLTPQQCAVDGSCPNDRLGKGADTFKSQHSSAQSLILILHSAALLQVQHPFLVSLVRCKPVAAAAARFPCWRPRTSPLHRLWHNGSHHSMCGSRLQPCRPPLTPAQSGGSALPAAAQSPRCCYSLSKWQQQQQQGVRRAQWTFPRLLPA